jgi:hypothetical protein
MLFAFCLYLIDLALAENETPVEGVGEVVVTGNTYKGGIYTVLIDGIQEVFFWDKARYGNKEPYAYHTNWYDVDKRTYTGN